MKANLILFMVLVLALTGCKKKTQQESVDAPQKTSKTSESTTAKQPSQVKRADDKISAVDKQSLTKQSVTKQTVPTVPNQPVTKAAESLSPRSSSQDGLKDWSNQDKYQTAKKDFAFGPGRRLHHRVH